MEDEFCGEGALSIGDGRVVKGTWNAGTLIDGALFNESFDAVVVSPHASVSSYHTASGESSLDGLQNLVKSKLRAFLAIL